MTSRLSSQDRRRVATLVHGLYHGHVTVESFVEELSDVDDPRVAELIRLVECEPELSGVSGVDREQYQAYRTLLLDLIGQLASLA